MIVKFIEGRLGQDPKIEEVKGSKVCKFSVACTYFAGKEKQTKWHNISVWGKQADACAQYLTKGQQVVVLGECSYSSKGEKEYENVTALKVQFLGKPEKAEESADIPF